MSKTCGKCGGRMAQGYLLEMADHYSIRVTKWVEGPPERGRTGNLKHGGREEFELETWRCERCFYLESYAPAP